MTNFPVAIQPRIASRRYAEFAATFALAISFLGCADSGAGRPDADNETTSAEVADTISVGDAFEVARDVLLKPPAYSPLVRISGLVVATTGEIVVTDASDAKVHVFDSTGSHLVSFGRLGSGPGEFRTPVYPGIDARGRVHVADLSRRVVSVWTMRGEFIREVSLSWASRIDQVAVAADGSYLAVANSAKQSNRQVLFLLDSMAQPVESWLPLADAPPERIDPSPVWSSVRRPSLSLRGDSAFVVHTLLDSMWVLEVHKRTMRVSALPSNQVRRVAPPPTFGSRLEQRAWIESMEYPTLVVRSSNAVLIALAGGPYFILDSSAVLLRRETGGWSRVTGVPPVLAAVDSHFVLNLFPSDSQTTLRFSRPRSR